MKTINRRAFLKGAVATAATAGILPKLTGCATSPTTPTAGSPAPFYARTLGANDEIRVAVVGFNGQGGSHISSIEGLRKKGDKVRIVALCDVDTKVLEKGVKMFADKGEKVETYQDIRKLLENKEIDAISTATPNHWHALITIWACQAGKDVYCEKPVSHNVSEGRRMVEAARKYNRIVQTGTQSRSSQSLKDAVAWVRAGNLGKIKVSRGLCYKPRGSIGKVTSPTPIPESIDYDLWCGPAEKLPLNRAKLHYDWHWVWNTGCGDLGNQGIHQMDIARWFLGEMELSPRIISVGGRLGYIDDGETPNTQIIFHDYEKAPLIFEVRGLPMKKGAKDMDKYKGGSVAVIIECEGGYVLVPSYTSATAYDKDGKEVQKWSGTSSHHGNFFDAMRSRKHTDLNADILQGHLSSALCHTGNISYRLGKKQAQGVIKEQLKAERDGLVTFDRMAAHLAANEVDIDLDNVTLGSFLQMDPKTERFPGNAAANQLLTRKYRAPFIVPERV